MTIPQSSSDERTQGLGLREGERRNGDRRQQERGSADRRRRDRRRNRIRSVAFSALALTLPSLYRTAPLTFLSDTLRPQVTTSVESITPITPQEAYEGAILEAAERFRLDPDLIRSVIQIESGFNALAVSPVGAQGLMQLMPRVADEMGVEDPFNPRDNIMGGSKLLRNLLTHFKGNVKLTLAGYNAGPGAVKRFRGKVPPFRETQNYVKRITRLMADNRDGD